MAEIGDKFTIEIGSKFCNSANETLYRIKGFNSLVFDENGISKLTPYRNDPEINVGDQFKENRSIRTVVVTKINKSSRRLDILWDDGEIGAYDIEQFHHNFIKTGINYSDQLDVIFGDLPY